MSTQAIVLTGTDTPDSATKSQLERVVELYSRTGWFRALIAAIPVVGGSIDALASTSAQNYGNARVEGGLALLALELAQLNDREERFRTWATALVDYLHRSDLYLSARIDDVDSRVQDQFKDPQLGRVISNYGYEAAREAMDERLLMLAAAAAGTKDPRLTIAQKARVERTIRELDPRDAITLSGLHRTVGTVDLDGKKLPSREHLLWRVWRDADSDALVAAGCVRLDTHTGFGGGWSELHITSLGRQVLQVLREYVAGREPHFAIPGRQKAPGERSATEAATALKAMPGLDDFFSYAHKASRIGIQYVTPTNPNAEGYRQQNISIPHLLFNIFEIDRLAYARDLAEKLKNGEVRAIVDASGLTASEPMFQFRLEGPHDLLRVAADELDASWI